MKKNPIIKITHLSKKIKKKIVLDNISLEILSGEVIGLIGPNGAGKTMLINTLLGLITPDFGTISFFGKEIQHNLSYIHQRTNLASGYSRLQEQLTVMQNLALFAGLYSTPHPQKKIKQLLHFFQLEKYINSQTKVMFLSSGEQTRLIICKSLLNDPDILFLDEPTASLDPLMKKIVIHYIYKLSKNNKKTIIFASHDLSEVKYLCDKVIFIKNGKITKIIITKNKMQKENLSKFY